MVKPFYCSGNPSYFIKTNTTWKQFHSFTAQQGVAHAPKLTALGIKMFVYVLLHITGLNSLAFVMKMALQSRKLQVKSLLLDTWPINACKLTVI